MSDFPAEATDGSPAPDHAPTDPHPAAGPPVGIVVVNYASSALIEANLGGLRLEHARVVVVDNYSGAAERSRISALAAEHGWTLVAPDDNRGFGAGVNAGARAAEQLGCGCFLLLNPDCQVTADTVEELRRASLADETALVAPQLVDLQGRVESGGSTLDLVSGRIRSLRRTLAEPDPTARPVTWLTAACLVVHREMWHRLSGFDETFFMYWEDVDFGYRALAQGGRPVLRTDLAGVHDQGGTQGPRRGRAKSDLYYFYNCRNRMLFASRHLDRRGLLRWLVRTPRITWEVLLQGGRRQLLESPRPAWAALRGGASGCWLGVRGLLPRRVRDLVS